MPERVEGEAAWVLRAAPYRETSLLVEVFCRDHGRTGLVARGVRGPRARQRGLLQPFTPLLLSWTRSGELATLTGAEPAGPPLALPGERSLHGLYLCELLLLLTARGDPHPGLFAAFGEALAELAAHPEGEAPLRRFELALLEETGYALPLDGEFEVDGRYTFDPETGASPAAAHDRETVSGATLLALREHRVDDAAQRRELRRLLRAAIDRRLGGRPLRSREWLRALRR